MMILLIDLQLCEHIPILFLQVFHLPEHNELFLVDYILRLVTHLIVGSYLLSLETVTTFVFLAVELRFYLVYLLLSLVKAVSDALDVAATLLRHLPKV